MDKDLEEFVRLVQAMRVAQSVYFKTRDHVILRTCKVLEKQVDAEVRRLSESTLQPTLF